MKDQEGILFHDFKKFKSVWYDFKQNNVCYIDQRNLPFSMDIYIAEDLESNIFAINEMVVRGAPAIGISAVWSIYQALYHGHDIYHVISSLRSTRPTAGDLFHMIDLVSSNWKGDLGYLREKCSCIEAEIIDKCRKIGEYGSELISEGMTILTHCNAGPLATVRWGTALAPMIFAHEKGVEFKVMVDETRPRLQGAKLTTWELKLAGIPHILITDNAAGFLMNQGEVDLVITGADRITRDGYVANKIGTYEKAVMAHENNVPFYVAAPSSTFDLSIRGRENIIIEYRGDLEISQVGGCQICPEDTEVLNPAFDITAPKYITGYITEMGIIGAEDIDSINF